MAKLIPLCLVWFCWSREYMKKKKIKGQKSRRFFSLSHFNYITKTITAIVARAFFSTFIPRAYSTFRTICRGERPRLVPERGATGMRLLDHVTQLAYFASRHVIIIVTVIVILGKGVIVTVELCERKRAE